MRVHGAGKQFASELREGAPLPQRQFPVEGLLRDALQRGFHFRGGALVREEPVEPREGQPGFALRDLVVAGEESLQHVATRPFARHDAFAQVEVEPVELFAHAAEVVQQLREELQNVSRAGLRGVLP